MNDSVYIINEEFLSKAECLHINNVLLNNKKLWQKTEGVKYFDFFPLGYYCSDHKMYFDNVVLYRELMYTLFQNVYDKIRELLRNFLNREIVFLSNYNYPGFHISNGLSMDNPNFHTDGFSFDINMIPNCYKLDFIKYNIFSVIVPTKVPLNGTGLLVRYNKHEEYVEYKPGMIAIWPGCVEHSIKPFNPINEDDRRITMQMHIALTNKRGYVFW